MSIKKSVILLLFSFITLPSIAKDKPVSYFIRKYHLPDDINILAVFGHDCINCYYGFSFFLKSHETEFKKNDFVFLFQKETSGEIDNIFKYQLELNKNDCHIIIDDLFYEAINKQGVTSLTIIEDKQIREQFISKDIGKFKSFAGSKVSQIISLVETDTIDLKGRFGTKNLSVAVVDSSTIVVHNQYTHDLFTFNTHQKKITRTLPLPFFTNRYDSLLALLLSDKPQELVYNLESYKTNVFYKTFPLCKIKNISCSDDIIYVGLIVTNMEKDTNNHAIYGGLQAIVKLDKNLVLQHVYKLPKGVPGAPGKNPGLTDLSFLNADTAVLSLSAAGDRKKDSIAVLYSLSTNQMKILELGYEPFMPLKGENGYYNYYHFDIGKDGDIIRGNFKSSPFIYNLSANTKEPLPGLNIDLKDFDMNGKDKYFWISKVFRYNNSMFAICTLKKNEMSLLQYDPSFKTLLSKKKILEGYLTDIFIIKDRLFAFEDFSEKGDVAVLHIYQLKK